MQIRHRLPEYIHLMRLDKPIGILLLLWPTLWALWLASHGHPSNKILFIFVGGVILMRSAGCIMNDIADRHYDPYVERTKTRPLAVGSISLPEAFGLAALLAFNAFLLVLLCNNLTIALAFIGAIVVIIYPLLKRFTYLPQFGLGVAFTWGVPMAFAAETGEVGFQAWFLFLTGMIWPIIYDTMYGMIDRVDDLKIGVKSTAILFDQMDKFLIALLQILFLTLMVIIGLMFHLHWQFFVALFGAGICFAYQQWLVRHRDPERCMRAFLNNNWVGLIIFMGILLSYF